MYFKDGYHEELFFEYVSELNCNDKYYKGFAYVASAIRKKQIFKALSDHRINHGMLLKDSGVWSNSEKAMLEVAYQLFSGQNFFYDEDGLVSFPTIESVFYSLDSQNTRVVYEAIGRRYS